MRDASVGGGLGREAERLRGGGHGAGSYDPLRMRTIEWRGDHAVLVDQTKLPHTVEWLEVRDVDTMIDAIRRLAVRGAPAIGVAGGFAVALAALGGTRRRPRARRGGAHRRGSPDGRQPVVGRAARRRPA